MDGRNNHQVVPLFQTSQNLFSFPVISYCFNSRHLPRVRCAVFHPSKFNKAKWIFYPTAKIFLQNEKRSLQNSSHLFMMEYANAFWNDKSAARIEYRWDRFIYSPSLILQRRSLLIGKFPLQWLVVGMDCCFTCCQGI